MSEVGNRWLRVTPAGLKWVAFASLLANVVIVLTGGTVRLTGSGLGCPTWPQCTDDSWVATPAMGIHGAVEFGNRTLTFVLSALAVAGLVGAWLLRPRRRALVVPAAWVLAGVVAQGVVGGITVLTSLNPWWVGLHYLLSIGIIAAAYTLWWRIGEPDGPARPVVPTAAWRLVQLLAAVCVVLQAVGTVVTGSGPHAGDARVPRNGLDPESLSQLHADLAFLMLGLAVAAVFALRAVAAPPAAVRAATAVVATLLAQGIVGMVQYFLGLPVLLVWLHMLGTCLVWLAVLWLWHTTRTTQPVATPTPTPAAATVGVGAGAA